MPPIPNYERINRENGQFADFEEDAHKIMNEIELLLQRWANFYVSMSQASAALIGLLFVVITIVVERRPNDIAKIRVYLTPTVVYFASVLVVAELLIIPNHTRLTSTLCICLVGVAGLVYSGSLFVGQGKKKSYYEQQDLIPYAVFPFAIYGLFVLGGSLLLYNTQRGFTLIAAGMLLLLTLAIRNSWAVVTDVVATRPGGSGT